MPQTVQKTTMRHEIKDETLVELSQRSHSAEYFEVLYDRYSKKVFNKCLSFTKERTRAEDLTHDIFVKVFFKLTSFNFQSKFSTWLYSVTYNFCIDDQKKQQKEQQLMDRYLEEESHQVNEPTDADLFEMQVDRLRVVLDLLTMDERVILLLKYQDGLSIKELTHATGLNESAVKMRLKRTRTKLLQLYKDRYTHNIY